MEKKELSQEQIEKIAAGTGTGHDYILIIHGLLVADAGLLKDEDALFAKAQAAGVNLERPHVFKVARAMKAFI